MTASQSSSESRNDVTMMAIATISDTLATMAASMAATRPGDARKYETARRAGTPEGCGAARSTMCASCGIARMPPMMISAIAK